MTESELELAIIQAIIKAEREIGCTFGQPERDMFRVGFVFGAQHANDNARRAIADARHA